MTPPRFLLDEHVPYAIQGKLLQLDAEMDILAVGQPMAPPKGTSDPDILTWIEKMGYILVTANRRTIPEHVRAHYAAGHHTLLEKPGFFASPVQRVGPFRGKKSKALTKILPISGA